MRHILPQTVARELRGPGTVACSGGPDSVALLLACLECGIEVSVAHVNHQLRGQESDDDEAFVNDLASKYSLKSDTVRIALPSVNIEAAARKARYEWFATLNTPWIATGHTMDDQAETVLHRIVRGTGLQGLRGIHREIDRLIRPLLTVTRDDVLDYLKEKNQTYRSDSSNADPRFTRNRIRHEVLPLLKSIQPNVVHNLCRLGEQAGESFEVIAASAGRLLREIELPRAGSLVVLNRGPFSGDDVHPQLVREMFRKLWERENWPTDRMTFAHWDRLAAHLLGKIDDFDLPGSIHAKRVGHVVQLGPRS